MAKAASQTAFRKVGIDRRFNKHMTALGHLTAMWSALEHRIDNTLWELANVERAAGICFTAQMIGPSRRGQALVALLRYRYGSDELVKAATKIIGKINGYGAERDRYVHDVWTINKSKTVLRIKTTTKKEMDELFTERAMMK